MSRHMCSNNNTNIPVFLSVIFSSLFKPLNADLGWHTQSQQNKQDMKKVDEMWNIFSPWQHSSNTSSCLTWSCLKWLPIVGVGDHLWPSRYWCANLWLNSNFTETFLFLFTNFLFHLLHSYFIIFKSTYLIKE